MRNKFDLTGKVAIVTGGGGLLGKAFCGGLAEQGAVVVAAEIDEQKGKKVADELTQKGYKALSVLLDISNEASVQQCLNHIISDLGKIDIWVNNAYPRTKDWGVRFENISWDSWRENVDRHLNGYCLCCQRVAEQMKLQQSGSIINLGSTYGIIAPDFSVYEGTEMTMPAAYAAIKGGIIQFTRYLAAYYGRFGVRVNTISPGGVFDHQAESFVKRYEAKTPLKRMANSEDIVGAVLFLASDSAAYVTGHNLVVDGGWSIL